MKKLFSTIVRTPSVLAVFAIELYQKTISPDHGMFKARYPHGFCRFYPSCSQYGKEAIVKHGLIRGVVMGVWRVARCNPWTKPQIDLISN
jgi:putative membrane protein insertion efficiency factor